MSSRRKRHPVRSKPASEPQLRIGISGWTYGPWRGVFYPAKLPHKRELEYASRQFNSIEINGSFYSLQTPRSYAHWYDQTPDDFVFAVKGGRYITHMRKLKDVRGALANFLASGVLLLKDKLGPILWQFPPMFKYDPDRFEAFFEMLPRDSVAAAKLARGHDEWMKDRAHIETDATRPMRHAVEIRHQSFLTEQFIDQLRRHGIALVLADTAGRWPYAEDMTADFVYARLHGDEELYVSGYDDPALKWWARRLKTWQKGSEPKDATRVGGPSNDKRARDIYVYFDNDVKVRAPFDAMRLRELITGERTQARADTSITITETARTTWPAIRRRGGTKSKR